MFLPCICDDLLESTNSALTHCAKLTKFTKELSCRWPLCKSCPLHTWGWLSQLYRCFGQGNYQVWSPMLPSIGHWLWDTSWLSPKIFAGGKKSKAEIHGRNSRLEAVCGLKMYKYRQFASTKPTQEHFDCSRGHGMSASKWVSVIFNGPRHRCRFRMWARAQSLLACPGIRWGYARFSWHLLFNQEM